jgi:hypothetical protein
MLKKKAMYRKYSTDGEHENTYVILIGTLGSKITLGNPRHDDRI